MLTNDIVSFEQPGHCLQKQCNFLQKNVRSFCSARAPHNFSAKNVTEIDFVSSVRPNESSTNDYKC